MGFHFVEIVLLILSINCLCVNCFLIDKVEKSNTYDKDADISDTMPYLKHGASTEDATDSPNTNGNVHTCSPDHFILRKDGCQMCSNFSAICIAKNSYVNVSLSNLTQDIEELVIILRNKHYGVFPSMDDPIVLSPMSKFCNLTKFELQMSPLERTSVKANWLEYEEDTFSNLNKLVDIRVNIPLVSSTNLTDMVKSLTSLQSLNFSRTITMQSAYLQATLSAVNKSSLQQLYLSNFQTIGAHGYSQMLNISTFFGPAVVESLTHLDLSHNFLGVMVPSISTMFPNLTMLDISYNFFILNDNTAAFVDMFLHENLEFINIGNQGYRFEETYESNDAISVSKGYISKITSDNSIPFFKVFLKCINLMTMGNISSLSDNNTMFCDMMTCIFKQYIKGFQHMGVPCYLLGTLGHSFDLNCAVFWRLPFFKKVRSINLDNLNWIIPEGYTFTGNLCVQNTNLSNVSAKNNKIWFQEEYIGDSLNSFGDIVGVDQVESVDISYSDGNFTFPLSISTKFLHLRNFQMAGNIIKFRNISSCQNCPNLMVLNISENGLTDSLLPDQLVHNCTELEVLILSNNFLNFTSTSLDLTGNYKLKLLDLSNNHILTLPIKLRTHLDNIAEFQRQHSGQVSLHVVLIDNPLQCLCTEGSLQFAEWLLEPNVQKTVNDQIVCYLKDNVHILHREVTDANFLQKQCSDFAIIIKSVVITASTALALFMISLGYFFRWKIRYNLYKISEKLKSCFSTGYQQDHPKTWKYDAFVSYSADDRFWVHDCLMKTVENIYGFKLCIHFRDFPLGDSISNAIIQAIEQSKDLIIVLTKTSITRPWCHLELETCLREAQRRAIKLAVIKLEDFPIPEDDTTLRWIMTHQVYLEWSENPDAQKLFWKRLINHLSGNFYQCRCCCFRLGDFEHVRAMDCGNAHTSSDGGDSEPMVEEKSVSVLEEADHPVEFSCNDKETEPLLDE